MGRGPADPVWSGPGGWAVAGVGARWAGVGAAIAGLQKTHAGASAHHAYIAGTLGPLVDDGVLPPVGPGFTRFLQAETTMTFRTTFVEREMVESTADPYDSHPPLRERIAALGSADGAQREGDPRPAIELLEGADALEQALVAGNVARARIVPPAPIAWEDVPACWIKRWRATTTALAQTPLDLTIATIPVAVAELRALLTKVEDSHMAGAASEAALRDWATQVLGAAIACALIDRGFTVSPVIGDPTELRDADRIVQPFRELAQYLEGETTAEAWRETWASAGVADHRLAAAEEGAAT